jgi:hypothetical protein
MSCAAPAPQRFRVMDFETRTDALIAACRATPGVAGLLLLGSTAAAGKARRDAWSDHDVFVLLEDDARDLATSLAFLPFPERIAVAAREGAIGRSVLYDDGHVIEFAVGTRAELDVVRAGTSELAVDDGRMAELAAHATRLQRPEPGADARDQVALALIKLVVGVGRLRRGEVVSGQAFIRTYVVGHLTSAVRQRLEPAATPVDARFDAVRRIERDHPAFGLALAAALDRPAEAAARAIFDLTRTTLEPGWPDFPTAAADAVARRLGW